MNVAVIGSTGILGRALIPRLVKAGHSVRAVARSTAKARTLLPDEVAIFECDLLSPGLEARLRPALRDCEAVFHIATAIPRDFSAPGAWDANTRIRTESVAAALKLSLELGIRRYVQQSITMAYPDNRDRWIDESLPLDSSPARAIVCAPVIEMERLVRAVVPSNLEWSILRGGSFVGRETFQDGTTKALGAGSLVVPGDGSNYVSLIHYDDMAAAVAAALTRAPAGSTFNIVDAPLTNGEYLDVLASRVGAPRPARDASAPMPPSWRCSNAAARAALGWAPVAGIYPK